MSQSLAANYIHAIFSTKRRQPFLGDPELRARLHAYVGGVSRNMQCPPIAVGGVEDHIHILVNLHKSVALADWLRDVKRASSQWAKEFPPEFAWQGGYAALSVSPSAVQSVRAYVENQEEHHRKRDFVEELRAVMAEHGIEWDERYFLD
jgi:putative transposase